MWGRKLYYIDSYGKVHRDRKAETASRSASGGHSVMGVVYTVLIVLAALMVLASLHR